VFCVVGNSVVDDLRRNAVPLVQRQSFDEEEITPPSFDNSPRRCDLLLLDVTEVKSSIVGGRLDFRKEGITFDDDHVVRGLGDNKSMSPSCSFCCCSIRQAEDCSFFSVLLEVSLEVLFSDFPRLHKSFLSRPMSIVNPYF
jgi:hypothetical protein